MPRIGKTWEKSADQIKVPLKVFNACGAQTWYLIEYDPEERIFYGFCNLGDPTCAECGTVSQDEMLETDQSLSPLVFMLERDFGWNAETTLQQVIDKVWKN